MRILGESILLTNGDMSADIQSPYQLVSQFQDAAIQASWTGSPIGSLKLQISNDDPHFVTPFNIVWSDYTGSTTAVSGPGNFLWNLVFVGYNLIRVVYTFSSGTGSLNITAAGKGPL